MQLNFQNGASPIINQILHFHDYLLFIVTLITIRVIYLIILVISSQFLNSHFKENHTLEILWTVIPALILLFIIFPSIKVLYYMEENNPLITLKTVGHQWFWSYEYSDISNLELDSYIANNLLNFRLLDTSNRIAIPLACNSRIITTSTDVIHSWTIPRLAIKSDAVPGRINQIHFLILRPGIYYGQCSEICGANHSFMPISLEAIPFKNFHTWLKSL
jgi:cytochrome c oxidase subunit 2